MRNPGENCEPHVESETSGACTEDSERDACSSPPCKRLKQAVLSFTALPSTPSTSPGSTKASVSPQNNSSSSCNFESKPSQACEVRPKVNGGLVTGAPSPPDVKDISPKPQASPNSTLVSKSLILENGDKKAKEQDTCSVSSPEANSPHAENELMLIDHSPTAKDKTQVDNGTPLPKSVEKKRRKDDREKERQVKQRLKEEKQKEREEAKALKEKERLEVKRKREQERQEKQAEKERKDKEKMEKKEKEEKERLEKKEKRDEERRKRDEEKNAKIEEKRKREAEKRSIEEEQERKRQKTQENFLSFFKKPSSFAPKTVVENDSRFKPFEVKTGMSVAPPVRKQLALDMKITLDEGLQQQEYSELYLRELERRKPIPKYTKTKLCTIAEDTESSPEATTPDEAIIIDENSNSSVEIIESKKETSVKVGLKYKLFKFHENYRPAYYGTWRKKSRKISPRNPLNKDTELLDYEVDSDDEWEEEEPGESLSNSEGEDEAEGDDDDEDDDGFFVPHGYLSDDEGVEEEEEATGESDEKENNSQSRKDQQLAKAKAWEAEMKRKCKPMKPLTVGCLWSEDALLNSILKRFAVCLLADEPIVVQSSTTSSKNNEILMADSPSSINSGALYVPDEAMPELIKLIHGNTAGLHKIMSIFRKQWTSKCLGRDIADEEVDEKCPISKRQLEKKIQNIATKERRTDRLRWFVHNHVLEKFGLDSLAVFDGFNSSDALGDAPMAAVVQQTNTQSIIQFVRPVSPALQRTTSSELDHQTQKLKDTSSPAHSSSSSMEVDSKSPSLYTNHHQSTPQGANLPGAENVHLCVGNQVLGSTKTIQVDSPTLISDAADTTPFLSQKSSLNIETVHID